MVRSAPFDRISPFTSSLVPGVAVPIPMFPAVSMIIFSVLFVRNRSGWLSVVPRNFVLFVPAFPTTFHESIYDCPRQSGFIYSTGVIFSHTIYWFAGHGFSTAFLKYWANIPPVRNPGGVGGVAAERPRGTILMSISVVMREREMEMSVRRDTIVGMWEDRKEWFLILDSWFLVLGSYLLVFIFYLLVFIF